MRQTTFPYDVIGTDFAIRSITFQPQSGTKRNIIVGGSPAGETSIHEIIFQNSGATNDKNGKQITPVFKSFDRDYKKVNGNLEKIGFTSIRGASFTVSILTHDKKFLVVYNWESGYNVYDMVDDKWLLKVNNMNIECRQHYVRRLLINDEILILSADREVYFYCICQKLQHFTNPQLIKKYTLKTDKLEYFNHGMCCTKYSETDDGYNIEIVLFGATYKVTFFESFLRLSVTINIACGDINFNVYITNEDKINFEIDNKEKWREMGINPTSTKYKKLVSFGYECVFNVQKEPIIIIVGGMNFFCDSKLEEDKTVLGCNIVSKNIIEKRNAKLYFCYTLFEVNVVFMFNLVCSLSLLTIIYFLPLGCLYCDSPATTLCNNDTRLIVLQETMLYYFDLSDCFLKWEIIRLIWIAFEKNDSEQCYLSQLPKDLIVYIISFLGNVKMNETNKNHCFDLDVVSNTKINRKEKDDERIKEAEAFKTEIKG